ncbi:hypothetical protein IJ732_02045 [bacterium]|nr:hypothetical protein [bacterium]
MNLNEECLLKYLKNSDDISYCTDVLKLNNQILEQKFLLRKFNKTAINMKHKNGVLV